MDEDNDCPRCHRAFTTDEGCERTKFCHHCAQALLDETTDALRALRDEQEGPPLYTREKEWRAAVDRADQLLATLGK